jgi:DNA (cytosine-5)-methyltransferase 1
MKHIGLFEGIGGFSLAARWMGWETVAWCEWNEFGQKVLKHHFPEAEGHGDITKTDFTKYANTIDILTGGFPCQPFSVSGKRKGTEDSRHLWPEMLRAIREIRPRWVVGENVSGIISWDGGLVFEQVQVDLENEGYKVQAVILPACSIDAPHRRDRVWFVAYSRYNSKGETKCCSNDEGSQFTTLHTQRQGRKRKAIFSNRYGNLQRVVTNTKRGSIKRKLFYKQRKRESRRYNSYRFSTNTTSIGRIQNNIKLESRKPKYASTSWERFPTQSPICGGNDGISRTMDGITFPRWRAESIKAYGNAIVPQVAYEIFKAIQQYEDLNTI